MAAWDLLDYTVFRNQNAVWRLYSKACCCRLHYVSSGVFFLWLSNTVFGSNKAVLLAISLGVIVYAVVLLAVGAVNRNDLEMLPGGVKLGRVLSRLKLIR